ncbi:copper chaperone CopZ [Staphylococcus aureus]|uniref:copper chaperone CopZ n=3 Tax=Staphylococcus aureus TaxID=1280 RepID=UPI00286FC9FB|nr:copper chaperone CopZ [Staphylococcus aureus]
MSTLWFTVGSSLQEILNVEGMSCGHCKSAVESALNNIDGVTSAEVNLENGQVSVQYDDSKVAVSQMKDAIEDQGYDVV